MKCLGDLNSRLVSIVFVAALILGGLARAATITVGPGVGHDFDMIQAGIDAANSGDTVLVAPGEYLITEPISFLGKAITVRSEAGPDETTVRMGTPADPQRASVVIFENSEAADSALDGFTITGGRGSSLDDWRGGGIVFTAASGTVRNCAIVKNTAKWGGGIYCFQPCSPSLIDCTIAENTAELGFGGGILSNVGSSMSVINCIIRDNSATGSVYGTGGGAGACCWGESSMTMTHCTIIGNSAGYGGGGIVSGENASVTLIHCTIVGNTGQNWGGGAMGWARASMTINNCTLAGNSAAISGGALGCYDQASATVTNSIFWGNKAAAGSEIYLYQDAADISVSYSNVAGGRAGVGVDGGKLNWGKGNIDMDPCFADPNNGDFHLKSQAARWDPHSQIWVKDEVTSPCIDRGDPYSDWSGELWSHGECINMGAYGGTPQASMSLSDAGHISDPVNLANDVPIDTDLHWRSDELTAKYDLYFGTSFEDVNNATMLNPLDVLVSQAQDANTYDPGMLDFAQTYYWRVDQVNGAPDYTVSRGPVWRFDVEPYSIQIPGSTIAVTASSTNNEFSTPERTIDGSGLHANDAHDMSSENMWFTAHIDLDPWIQYEFDAVKKLDTMTVWNSNSAAEMGIGWGVKDVEIAYSMDGETWDVLADANQFNRAPGLHTYNQFDEIDFEGAAAKMVRLNIQSNWGGMLMSYSLSEVQFSMIPAAARNPEPASGSVDVLPDAMLSWRSGRDAAQHTIYVSTDQNEVANGLAPSVTSSTHSLDLSSLDLELGQTTYWRVDEVNEAEAVSVWAGDVWHFTTLSSLTVDDFERYSNLSPYRVFQTWIDGSGFTNPAPGNPGNNTGSDIGHDIWSVASPHFQGSIMETGSTPAGSHLAMPVYYDNSGANGKPTYSQVDYAVGGQDWTAHGLRTLSIAFRGTTVNTGTLYVTINHTKLVYNGDADDITREQWQQWNIDLTLLDGLQNVTTLAIGVDDANAAGTLYIDDIRLYP